jgi:hypothetical protein
MSEPARCVALAGLSGPAGLIILDFTYTSLASGFHRQDAAQDMLLRSEEVQYVCRYAARHSYGRSKRG